MKLCQACAIIYIVSQWLVSTKIGETKMFEVIDGELRLKEVEEKNATNYIDLFFDLLPAFGVLFCMVALVAS
jgi:flagellar motor component MotA